MKVKPEKYHAMSLANWHDSIITLWIIPGKKLITFLIKTINK